MTLLELGVLGPDSAAPTSGNFFEALTASEFYKNTKVLFVAPYVVEKALIYMVFSSFLH